MSQNPHQLVTLSTVPPGRTMEVTVPTTLNVLNGSDARLPCTFNSCYTVNHKQFSLNWTYQECSNCSEEMVSPQRGAAGREGAGAPGHEAHISHCVPLAVDQDPGDPGGQSAPEGFGRRCVVAPGRPWGGGRDLEVAASLPGNQVDGGEGRTPSPCSCSLMWFLLPSSSSSA